MTYGIMPVIVAIHSVKRKKLSQCQSATVQIE